MGLIYDIFEQFSIEVFYSIVISYIIMLCALFVNLTAISYTNTINVCIAFYSAIFVLQFIFVWSFTLVLFIISLSLICINFLYFNIVVSISMVYKKLGGFLNFIYLSLVEIIENNISNNSSFYLVLLLEIILLISCLNILGMIPYSFSVTSQILFPFTLSLTFFLYNNIIGMYSYSYKVFNLFMPSGVPLFITPLLLIIEYISYFASIFSLSIRLCANMLSVHVLLNILIGFSIILLYQSLWGQYLLILLLSIFLLDISTCFLQAYIFVFLSLVYLSNIAFMH